MAVTPGKDRGGLSPRVLLASAAVFITLSGVAEALQCYWCGPLADQVHRSRRAPSCEPGARHVTACDPGHAHCAIVAASPPYVESRFCVKIYQDECYPLFCNSTKTWRMTCPCRGALCNGAVGDREAEAFAVLAKLVARTHSRIIKRSTSNLKGSRRKIVNSDDEETISNNTVEGNEEVAKQNDEGTNDTTTKTKILGQEQTTENENDETQEKNQLSTITIQSFAAEKEQTINDAGSSSTNMIEIEIKKTNSIIDTNDSAGETIVHEINIQGNKNIDHVKINQEMGTSGSSDQTTTTSNKITEPYYPTTDLFNTSTEPTVLNISPATELPTKSTVPMRKPIAPVDSIDTSSKKSIEVTELSFSNIQNMTKNVYSVTEATELVFSSSAARASTDTDVKSSVDHSKKTTLQPTAEAFQLDNPITVKPAPEQSTDILRKTQNIPITTQKAFDTMTRALVSTNSPTNTILISTRSPKEKRKNYAVKISADITIIIIHVTILSSFVY